MTAIVADASALLELLLVRAKAAAMADLIGSPGVDVHVPSLCDIEVMAGLRRHLLRHQLSEQRAAQALTHYVRLPLMRHGHEGLMARILELRANVTAYDAAYVALAERLDAQLLTADEALARAARAHTGVTVIP